jgi:hypothetical protein
MTFEELERAAEFVVKQQAQFVTDLAEAGGWPAPASNTLVQPLTSLSIPSRSRRRRPRP